MDRRITIYVPTTTKDPTYGSESQTWAPLVALPGSPTVAAKMWANISQVPASRAESVKLQAINIASNQARITIRYRNDVDSTMKIVVHGDSDITYQIIGGPEEIGRRQYLQMMCEAVEQWPTVN